MDEVARTLTKQMLDDTMREILTRKRPDDVIRVSSEFASMIGIITRSIAEDWDWRRVKRESRKGPRSTYQRRVS